MPSVHPREFRDRAVGLAHDRVKPVAQIAKDLGVSDSCLRGWIPGRGFRHQARCHTDERAELVRLRREIRILGLENQILERAAAYFVRENVLPK